MLKLQSNCILMKILISEMIFLKNLWLSSINATDENPSPTKFKWLTLGALGLLRFIASPAHISSLLLTGFLISPRCSACFVDVHVDGSEARTLGRRLPSWLPIADGPPRLCYLFPSLSASDFTHFIEILVFCWKAAIACYNFSFGTAERWQSGRMYLTRNQA